MYIYTCIYTYITSADEAGGFPCRMAPDAILVWRSVPGDASMGAMAKEDSEPSGRSGGPKRKQALRSAFVV